MNSIRFIESEMGSRRINPALASNEFAIGKVAIPRFVREFAQMKYPGNSQFDFYQVVTGSLIDPSLVDAIVNRASWVTRALGFEDDLSETAGLGPNDPNYQTFRLTHSLEHFAACDIFIRGKEQLTRVKGTKWATSGVYGSGFPFRRVVAGLYFNPKLTNPNELDVSVRNAARMATSIYSNQFNFED